MQLETFGNGPNIYLGIHGWGGSARTFDPLLAHLPPHVTFHSISLPGYGGTSRPTSWELSSVVEPLAEQMARLNATNITLVGNCSGAIFGMLAAQRCPTSIQRLVLIDAFAYMPWYLRVLTLPVVGPLFYFSSFGNPLGRWLTNGALRSKRNEQTDLTQSFAHIDHITTFQYLRLLSQVGPYQQFQTLQMPVDLLMGERSFRAIHHSVTLWQSIWPHARVWPLSRGGHLPILESTDLVAQILFQSNLPNATTLQTISPNMAPLQNF